MAMPAVFQMRRTIVNMGNAPLPATKDSTITIHVQLVLAIILIIAAAVYAAEAKFQTGLDLSAGAVFAQ